MLPNNIKYISIDILMIDHIKILIEKLNFISSFKFKYSFDKSIYIKSIIEWLTNNKYNYTYILDIHYLSVWISSNKVSENKSNKKIKLT